MTGNPTLDFFLGLGDWAVVCLGMLIFAFVYLALFGIALIGCLALHLVWKWLRRESWNGLVLSVQEHIFRV